MFIDGRPLEGTFKASVLLGDSPDAYNDIAHPDRVIPKKFKIKFVNGMANLPTHSIVNIVFDQGGKK